MKTIICLLIIFLFPISVEAKLDKYSKTGHDQFSELVFVDEDRELLINMTDKYVNENLGRIKSKFFGSSTRYLYRYKDVNYISTVVFSRSNKTSEKFVFDYSLQTVHFKESSFNVKGSLSYKTVNKTKDVDNQFTADVSVEYSTVESNKETENSAMKSLMIFTSKGKFIRMFLPLLLVKCSRRSSKLR